MKIIKFYTYKKVYIKKIKYLKLNLHTKKHWNKLISWHALNIPTIPNEPIILIYKLHQKYQMYVINNLFLLYLSNIPN